MSERGVFDRDTRDRTYKADAVPVRHVTTLFAAVRERATVWDLLGLLVVPVALLAVGTVPVETRRAFVFSYESPTVVTAYTAHFVHLTRSHLLVNLASYALVVPTGYVLAVVSGRREQYLTGFVTALVALPVALSALNLAFVRPRVGYGFSGVAMGLVALVAVELFAYAESQLTTCLRREDAAGVFFAEVALMAAVVRPRTRATLAVAAVAGILAAGYAVVVGRQLRRDGAVWTDRARQPGYLEAAAAAVVLLVGFPFVAFPPDPTGDGTVLNLYTHLLGFALVFLAAYIQPLVADRFGATPVGK